jgi:hypothetical protein
MEKIMFRDLVKFSILALVGWSASTYGGTWVRINGNLVYIKSYHCRIDLDNVPSDGALKGNDKYLGCNITPTPLVTPTGEVSPVRAVVFCENGGSHVATGVNSLDSSSTGGSLARNVKVTSSTKGHATVEIIIDPIGDPLSPSEIEIKAEAETICDTELNPNWSAKEVAFCDITSNATAADSRAADGTLTDILDSKTSQCHLPVSQCNDAYHNFAKELTWDDFTLTDPTKFVYYVDTSSTDPQHQKLCGQ